MSENNTQETPTEVQNGADPVENKNPIPSPVIPNEEQEQSETQETPTEVQNGADPEQNSDDEIEEEVKGILQPIIDGLPDLKKFDLYESILQILTMENREFKSSISSVIDLLASKGLESKKFTIDQWNNVFAEKIIKSVNTEIFDRLSSAMEGILHQTTDKKTKLSLWSSAIDSFLAELAH
ncbi:hypothetical protein LEP1GSC163_0163 [Leptospira santarosai str. CBC379]|uniref:hypothetical protein n=1 Tax=Leptospira santarosai TaxID=28183 RepID=UPI0002981C71|nr:hypothetical protein [Leptospira santarosai]EKR89709.1 hypothetical protein LEP1GSC163_0163 [Leptospira santarosai str. CBC379]